MRKNRDEKFLKALAKKVKKIRNERGLSTYQLSYDTDISRSQITALEKAEINPTICTLKALAKGLQIELKDLVDV